MYSLNVVKPSRIKEYAKAFAPAAASLETWLKKAAHAEWSNLIEVKATINSVDQVTVASGRRVLVFNIAGNGFRLIVAAHFNRKTLYVLRFMTHAEYSKDKWKNEL